MGCQLHGPVARAVLPWWRNLSASYGVEAIAVSTVPIRSAGAGRPAGVSGRLASWPAWVAAARLAGLVLAGGVIAGLALGLLGASLLTLLLVPIALISSRTRWLGVPFLAVTAWLVRPLAWLERHRVRVMTGTRVAALYRPLDGSHRARVRPVLADPGTWRDLCWLAAMGMAGALGVAYLAALAAGPVLMVGTPFWVAFHHGPRHHYWALVLIPLGVGCLIASWYGGRRLPAETIRPSCWLLAPPEGARLREQMEHLAETRDETVDARAAELRRIERDLHDGAQARLVSLTMSLGLAEQEFDRRPEAARQLVVEARASARTALHELRHLVRGIHPPVLTERGLGGAAEALALASAVPVEVDVRLGERLPAPLESALYFVIAEALANIARHSEASWAFVRLWPEEGRLRLMVHDDGHGGADPARGTGLRGIERRLAAFDGRMTVSSPPGGPTELFAELPCRP
jgi:signal transduction histidine kinase